MFAPSKTFQHSVIFVRETGAYPSGTLDPYLGRLLGPQCRTFYTRLEKLAEEKHPSLFVINGMKCSCFITAPTTKKASVFVQSLTFAARLGGNPEVLRSGELEPC